MSKLFVFIVFLFSFVNSMAQSVEGVVLDQDNNPIPFAKVWVKGYANLGTMTNNEGFYKITFETPNSYEILFSVVGYEKQTHSILIEDFETVEKNIYLKVSIDELELVDVYTKRKNVGYEIIKKVMTNKEKMSNNYDAFSVDVYLKGTETYDFKQKKKEIEEEEILIEDSFEKEEVVDAALNLVEKKVTIHYQAPKELKEIKNAEYKLGYPEHIYLEDAPVFVDVFFNFYDNLIYKNRLHEGPLISPLNYAGLLSYKYKLTDIIQEENDTIYKIHIKPRSVGTTTLEGDLYVLKNEWVLTKVDLKMRKGNLKAYDDFGIVQYYEKLDSTWIVTKQTFSYHTKYGKELIYGETEVVYSNYVLNPEFDPKFFNNEVALTVDDAYEKDSTYWSENRPIALTPEEQRKKFVQDSISVAHSKKEYLDSIDNEFNRITLYKLFSDGISRRNREKQRQWTFPSIPGLVEPVGIAGPRVSGFVGYFKRFDNNQRLFTGVSASFGVLNKDLRGGARLNYLYNAKKLARFEAYIDHDVELINNYVPYLDYIDPGNFYFNDIIRVNHKFEVLNGLYLETGVDLSRRSSIADLDFYNWQGEALQTSDPIVFDPYNILKTDITVSYTPAQKFISEPSKKIVLGSKWPTFALNHKKGIKNVLGSGVDFDQLTLSVSQRFNIGTIGRSNYTLELGKFVNKDSVYYIDQKFFRAGDVGLTGLIMSNPEISFQNLEQAYQTRNLYAQFHYVHHFNGAIINKIPFMKKTRIRSLAGGGMLFLPEYDNLYYQEVFFGIQRQFKFLRERIKIGTFVVFSDSNKQPAKVQFKVLFEVVNLRDVMFEM